MNLLLDENLSASLIARLATNGISAQHAAYVGLSGKSDSEVWRYAFGHEQVVVTINAKDFINLAASTEIPPGLIILRQSGLTPDQQWAWIRPAIDLLKDEGDQGHDLINRAIEIFSPEHFVIRELPDHNKS